ncbi:methylated-DNA--[protein]-cysteine S-methyltransferase [Alteromonas sp. CYL-A6]|uniref:methylated-DNA--[protein]-cysteine S-methyltransferase n=1 Tax=Alteromonas nitratireducens TaxID=3390813 RepID=UPI0034B3C9E9
MKYLEYQDSPWGRLMLRADQVGITMVAFDAGSAEHPNPSPITSQARRELEAYINGRLTRFTVPLNPAGTPFQQAVWQALCSVEFGTTASYADIARQLNNPNAVRAVGMANSRNPVAILIPCHRIIGSNGTLTGYAGGLERKAALLRHEGGQHSLWA